MPGSNFFTFFMPKNDLFFDFWTPLIFGPEARFFFGISLKFLHQFFFQVGSPQTVHLKIPSFLKSDATLGGTVGGVVPLRGHKGVSHP